MYMKQGQILQIRDAVEEIKKLATLETCALDEETKEKMKLWVMWFSCYAIKIELALDGEIDERYR